MGNPREEIEVDVAFAPKRVGSFKDDVVVVSRGMDGKGSKQVRVRASTAATADALAAATVAGIHQVRPEMPPTND